MNRLPQLSSVVRHLAATSLLIVLVAGFLPGRLAIAQAPGPASATISTAHVTPVPAADVEADWWAAVQEQIRRSEYDVTWQDTTYLPDLSASYQAPNRAQNVRTYFAPQGPVIVSRTSVGDVPAPAWRVDLHLAAWGWAGAAQAPGQPGLHPSGNRIEYRYPDLTGLPNLSGLTEWYVNTEQGLEQGFTLPSPTVGRGAGGEVVLDLALDTGLEARMAADGTAVEFIDASGTTVLHYGDLHATDAAGRALSARLELLQPSTLNLQPSTLRLAIDATEAIFPITLDSRITGLSPAPDWTLTGIYLVDLTVSTAGDVNGDGYDDVIVGSPYWSAVNDEAGAAFLYYGSATGLGTTAAWTAESNRYMAHFGRSVGTAGDVNGDGYADVIVGLDGENYSAAYVYYGSAAGLSTTADWTVESFAGRFGCSVGTAGDVNGDGYADVIVGGFGYADVYHGSASGLSTTAAWTVESDQVGSYFGYSAGTAGDVNGDGYADVIVGAFYYTNDQTHEGRAYVYHGSATGLSTTANWTAESDQDTGYFGNSVGTAGDVNGDGYADVIVGAPYYDNGQDGEGRAFVYHGSASGLSTTADWTAESDQAGAMFGYAVGTAGDVNGDGGADVIVGARMYSYQGSYGAAFVYHGSATGISTAADWTGESNQPGADFGWSVGTAGDINGDGYADVVVGAPTYDNGQTNEGRAFVYHGSGSGLGTTAAWTAEGDQVDAYFGWSAGTAGDVNGDGYADVIVGAPHYDNGQTDEGRAYVYHGSASGLGTSAAWTAESDQAGAQFGASAGTAGDVNGDGYADVIVGAPSYDNGQTDEGAAFVYHGSASGLSATAAWTAESDQAGAQFGWSAGTAGDVNGDGYADVIVGAPRYDNGQTDEGRAFVYHGAAAGLSTSAAWTAERNWADAYFGYSAGAAGDMNGDGYADVIVGAPGYENGETDEGGISFYSGSASGLSAYPDWTAESDQAGARFGWSAGTAGDVNGDGYADVIVGAPYYDNSQVDEGRVSIYYGLSSGLMSNRTVESNQAYAHFGWSVGMAGDVNGDGYADVIVGAPMCHDGQAQEGCAFVYHGSATGLSTTANWTANSPQSGDRFGWSAGTAGDVNGDGYADVIVGAYWYDNGENNEGRAFVYYGSAAGPSITANWTAESNQASASFGYAVGTAGDVNGDGYADVIVGASNYTNGEAGEGRAYVYYGSAAGLSTAAAWMAESNQGAGIFGRSVGTAGDVNGDGYADIIVGADWPNLSGRAFVYYGSATGPSTTANWTAQGNQGHAQFGRSVGTAGDVNGDGYADVIVGALGYTNSEYQEGGAFVYHGSATGLSTTAAWTAESNQASAYFGYAVGTAGDVNGDGYADVIVGAITYDNGETDEGGAFVYHGSATGLSTAAAWTAESNSTNAQFGWSVGTAGDVNGDGYADVIVGASNAGYAYVYHGSAAGLGTTAAWTAGTGGYSVGTAGDVNGDGYADVIVGVADAPVYVYFGNGGVNWPVKPQQRRADDSAPVAPGGQSISPTEVRLAALAATPFGRSQVGLQWEVKPEGTAFDGAGLGQSAWQEGGAAGYAFDELVSSLSFETRYHWRVRIVGRPARAATNSAVTYHSRWLRPAASSFFTALSGEQAIGETGQMNLLGQAASVNVTGLGSPALTELTLRGYPQTAHSQEIAHSGGAAQVLDRYFSVTPNGGAAGYNAGLCLNYDDAEVAAAGVVEDQLSLCRWTGAAWICHARASGSSTSNNLVCAAGVTTFSDWALATGCTAAPAEAPEAVVTRSGNDVLLTWGASSANARYEVWVSTNPYFDPDNPGSVTPIYTEGTSYTDTGAAASLVNHFYVVRGLNACGATSANSGRRGEFTFGLTPGN